MTIRPFLHLPPPATLNSFADVSTYLRRMWESLQNVRRGKIECVVEFTLTANAATSTLTDPRLSIQSAVIFDPVTANAATELYGATMYALEANRAAGAWVITHANNAQTDREFRAVIIG
jgi:hypothetical protein